MSKLRHVALLLAGVVLVAIVPGVASALPDVPPSVGTSAIAPQAWAPSGVAGAEVQGTITATRIVPATATSAAQENIITCTVDKQYPHRSTHVPGTVNVVVVVSCDDFVSQLETGVSLYRDGSLVAQSGPERRSYAAVVQANASEQCHNALYGSWRYFSVWFPPGYTPSWATWPPSSDPSLGFGPGNAITC